MMFNLPVVATDWRGLPEIVIEGQTGFLVPPKDAENLADRLERLILNPELRISMGKAGRRRYEKCFTVQKFRENMELALASL